VVFGSDRLFVVWEGDREISNIGRVIGTLERIDLAGVSSLYTKTI
jgi:hypothetical protein